MSFLSHISNCNRYNMKNFIPFEVGDHRVGWIKEPLLSHFSSFPKLVQCSSEKVRCNPELNTPTLLGSAMADIGEKLTAAGFTEPWRQEPYAVGTRFGECLFQLERAILPAFGVRGCGVHLTGYVKKKGQIYVWVPRRTEDRPTYPGKLDNTVAGGQPAHLSLAENLLKECDEEAGLPPHLVRRARPVGSIPYRLERKYGLQDGLIFSYELELPLNFTPRNQDGELESFELWPIEEVAKRVESTEEFKFNCNLVLIQFFMRHGYISSSHPDYERLQSGLQGSQNGPK